MATSRPRLCFHRVRRFVAAPLVLCFLTTSASAQPALVSPLAPLRTQGTLPLSGSLKIPDNMGRVESFHDAGEGRPFVFFIQDAHAIVDAQANIRRLIELFEKDYGVKLVGVEGGEGKLDPLVFRAFPDGFVKEKVMRDYLQQGEITGAGLASIFSPSASAYFGIEDWTLYEQNYLAYLKTTVDRDKVLKVLSRVKEKLNAQEKAVFTPELQEFHEQSEKFYSERSHLLEYLKYLAQLKSDMTPEENEALVKKYPHLATMWDSINRGGVQSLDLDASIRRMAKSFQEHYADKLDRKTQMEFNGMVQKFVSGQADAGKFLRYLVETGKAAGLSPRLSPEMRDLIGHTEKISQIKGTRLFEELEAFAAEREKSLIQNEMQSRLSQDFDRLRLLGDLVRLELSREQLEAYQRDSEGHLALLEDAERGLMNPALEFYRVALERDQVFHEKIDRLMKSEKASSAVVLAGGFHAKGFERELQDKGYSFAVITPAMDSLDGQSVYQTVMTGKVSYAKDIEKSFYEAFVKHSTAALVRDLNEPDFRRTVKLWRDEIIRMLASEGRTVEAGAYTRSLDQLVRIYNKKFGGNPKSKTLPEILDETDRAMQEFKKEMLETMWSKFQSRMNDFFAGRGAGTAPAPSPQSVLSPTVANLIRSDLRTDDPVLVAATQGAAAAARINLGNLAASAQPALEAVTSAQVASALNDLSPAASQTVLDLPAVRALRSELQLAAKAGDQLGAEAQTNSVKFTGALDARVTEIINSLPQSQRSQQGDAALRAAILSSLKQDFPSAVSAVSGNKVQETPENVKSFDRSELRSGIRSETVGPEGDRGVYRYSADPDGGDRVFTRPADQSEINIAVGSFGLFSTEEYTRMQKLRTDCADTCTALGVRAVKSEEPFIGLGHIFIQGGGQVKYSLREHVKSILNKLMNQGKFQASDFKDLVISYRDGSYKDKNTGEAPFYQRAEVISPEALEQEFRSDPFFENINLTFHRRGLANDESFVVDMEVSRQGVEIYPSYTKGADRKLVQGVNWGESSGSNQTAVQERSELRSTENTDLPDDDFVMELDTQALAEQASRFVKLDTGSMLWNSYNSTISALKAWNEDQAALEGVLTEQGDSILESLRQLGVSVEGIQAAEPGSAGQLQKSLQAFLKNPEAAAETIIRFTMVQESIEESELAGLSVSDLSWYFANRESLEANPEAIRAAVSALQLSPENLESWKQLIRELSKGFKKQALSTEQLQAVFSAFLGLNFDALNETLRPHVKPEVSADDAKLVAFTSEKRATSKFSTREEALMDIGTSFSLLLNNHFPKDQLGDVLGGLIQSRLSAVPQGDPIAAAQENEEFRELQKSIPGLAALLFHPNKAKVLFEALSALRVGFNQLKNERNNFSVPLGNGVFARVDTGSYRRFILGETTASGETAAIEIKIPGELQHKVEVKNNDFEVSEKFRAISALAGQFQHTLAVIDYPAVAYRLYGMNVDFAQKKFPFKVIISAYDMGIHAQRSRLSDYISTQGDRLTPGEAVEIARQVAALAFQGIISHGWSGGRDLVHFQNFAIVKSDTGQIKVSIVNDFAGFRPLVSQEQVDANETSYFSLQGEAVKMNRSAEDEIQTVLSQASQEALRSLKDQGILDEQGQFSARSELRTNLDKDRVFQPLTHEEWAVRNYDRFWQHFSLDEERYQSTPEYVRLDGVFYIQKNAGFENALAKTRQEILRRGKDEKIVVLTEGQQYKGGLSFKHHFHTTLSLAFLSKVSPALKDETLIDLGAGSGVLGITALLRDGARNVLAVDLDQDSLNRALEALALTEQINGLSPGTLSSKFKAFPVSYADFGKQLAANNFRLLKSEVSPFPVLITNNDRPWSLPDLLKEELGAWLKASSAERLPAPSHILIAGSSFEDDESSERHEMVSRDTFRRGALPEGWRLLPAEIRDGDDEFATTYLGVIYQSPSYQGRLREIESYRSELRSEKAEDPLVRLSEIAKKAGFKSVVMMNSAVRIANNPMTGDESRDEAWVTKMLGEVKTGAQKEGLSWARTQIMRGPIPIQVIEIVYRDKEFKPVAMARLTQNLMDQWHLHTIAADRSRGVLAGRAVYAIGMEALNHISDLSPGSAQLSPDGAAFMNAAVKRMFKNLSDEEREFIGLKPESARSELRSEDTEEIQDVGEVLAAASLQKKIAAQVQGVESILLAGTLNLSEDERAILIKRIAQLDYEAFGNKGKVPASKAAQVEGGFNRGADFYILADKSGQVLGYIQSSANPQAQSAYLYKLAAKQGGGRGARLMDRYFSDLAAQDIHTVSWVADGFSAGFYTRYLNGKVAYDTTSAATTFAADLTTYDFKASKSLLSAEIVNRQQEFLARIKERENEVREKIKSLSQNAGEYRVSIQADGETLELPASVDAAGKWLVAMMPEMDGKTAEDSLLRVLMYNGTAKLTAEDGSVVLAPSGMDDFRTIQAKEARSELRQALAEGASEEAADVFSLRDRPAVSPFDSAQRWLRSQLLGEIDRSNSFTAQNASLVSRLAEQIKQGGGVTEFVGEAGGLSVYRTYGLLESAEVLVFLQNGSIKDIALNTTAENMRYALNPQGVPVPLDDPDAMVINRYISLARAPREQLVQALFPLLASAPKASQGIDRVYVPAAGLLSDRQSLSIMASESPVFRNILERLNKLPAGSAEDNLRFRVSGVYEFARDDSTSAAFFDGRRPHFQMAFRLEDFSDNIKATIYHEFQHDSFRGIPDETKKKLTEYLKTEEPVLYGYMQSYDSSRILDEALAHIVEIFAPERSRVRGVLIDAEEDGVQVVAIKGETLDLLVSNGLLPREAAEQYRTRFYTTEEEELTEAGARSELRATDELPFDFETNDPKAFVDAILSNSAEIFKTLSTYERKTSKNARRSLEEDAGVSAVVVRQAERPTVYIGDLHGRVDVFLAILHDSVQLKEGRMTVLEALKRGLINIRQVGDIIHPSFDYDNQDAHLESFALFTAFLALKNAMPDQIDVIIGNHESASLIDESSSEKDKRFSPVYRRKDKDSEDAVDLDKVFQQSIKTKAGDSKGWTRYSRTVDGSRKIFSPSEVGDDLLDVYLRAIKSLPVMVKEQTGKTGIGVVHAGPPAERSDITPQELDHVADDRRGGTPYRDLLWTRESEGSGETAREHLKEFSKNQGISLLIHGHTPLPNFRKSTAMTVYTDEKAAVFGIMSTDEGQHQIVIDAAYTRQGKVGYLLIDPSAGIPRDPSQLKAPEGQSAFRVLDLTKQAPSQAFTPSAANAAAKPAPKIPGAGKISKPSGEYRDTRVFNGGDFYFKIAIEDEWVIVYETSPAGDITRELKRQYIEDGKTATLGRGGSDFVIPGTKYVHASRLQASIVRKGDQYFLSDQGLSLNGTYADGQKIDHEELRFTEKIDTSSKPSVKQTVYATGTDFTPVPLDAQGLVDVAKLLVPAQMPTPAELVDEIRNYILLYVKDPEKQAHALKNLTDPVIAPLLLPYMMEARKSNILLVVSQDAYGKAGFEMILKPQLEILKKVFEVLPRELMWEMTAPQGYELTETGDRVAGYQITENTMAGGGIGKIKNLEEARRTTIHEILGHKRHNTKALKFELSADGSQVRRLEGPDAWNMIVDGKTWLRIAELNGETTLIPFTDELKESMEKGYSISFSNESLKVSRIAEMSDQEVLYLMRNLYVHAFGYHNDLREILAFSISGEDLSKPSGDKNEIRNARLKYAETRRILLESAGRIVSIPVDPKSQVYRSYIFNPSTAKFDTVYLQKIGEEFLRVERRGQVWVLLEQPSKTPVLQPTPPVQPVKAAPVRKSAQVSAPVQGTSNQTEISKEVLEIGRGLFQVQKNGREISVVSVDGKIQSKAVVVQGIEVFKIGTKSGNALVLNDATVSGYHAQIRLGDDGVYRVVDQGSRNGTRIQGAQRANSIVLNFEPVPMAAPVEAGEDQAGTFPAAGLNPVLSGDELEDAEQFFKEEARRQREQRSSWAPLEYLNKDRGAEWVLEKLFSDGVIRAERGTEPDFAKLLASLDLQSLSVTESEIPEALKPYFIAALDFFAASGNSPEGARERRDVLASAVKLADFLTSLERAENSYKTSMFLSLLQREARNKTQLNSPETASFFRTVFQKGLKSQSFLAAAASAKLPQYVDQVFRPVRSELRLAEVPQEAGVYLSQSDLEKLSAVAQGITQSLESLRAEVMDNAQSQQAALDQSFTASLSDVSAVLRQAQTTDDLLDLIFKGDFNAQITAAFEKNSGALTGGAKAALTEVSGKLSERIRNSIVSSVLASEIASTVASSEAMARLSPQARALLESRNTAILQAAYDELRSKGVLTLPVGKFLPDTTPSKEAWFLSSAYLNASEDRAKAAMQKQIKEFFEAKGATLTVGYTVGTPEERIALEITKFLSAALAVGRRFGESLRAGKLGYEIQSAQNPVFVLSSGEGTIQRSPRDNLDKAKGLVGSEQFLSPEALSHKDYLLLADLVVHSPYLYGQLKEKEGFAFGVMDQQVLNSFIGFLNELASTKAAEAVVRASA